MGLVAERPDYVRNASGQPVRWHRATGPDGQPREWAADSGGELPSDQEMREVPSSFLASKGCSAVASSAQP